MRQWKDDHEDESRFGIKPIHKMWATFWMMIFDVAIAIVVIGDYVFGINNDELYLLLAGFLLLVAFMLGRTSYHHYKEIYLKQF